MTVFAMLFLAAGAAVWPDGSAVDAWFSDRTPVEARLKGREYRFDESGIFPDGQSKTAAIQSLIDRAAAEGGGVIVATPGVYRSGSLFFKPKVHLRLQEGAIIQAAEDPSEFPTVPSRIEGKTRPFTAALVNADRCDGFTLVGPGILDGNGYPAWRSNVLAREAGRIRSNIEGRRVRILFVSHSRDVRVSGVRLQNSQFWTQHFWQCENVHLENVSVFSANRVMGHVGCCTDGVDLDAVKNAVIRGCRIENFDDAIAIKGGGGNWADDYVRSPGNGPVENVLVEDCEFGFTHGALVFGSEATKVRNVVMRRCRMDGAMRVLWLKFRADTPQDYRNVLVEDITGAAEWFLYARLYADTRDWKQGRAKDELRSVASNVTMRNCDVVCREFFDVRADKSAGEMSDFTFENIVIRGEETGYDEKAIARSVFRNIRASQAMWKGLRHDDPDRFVGFLYGINGERSAAAIPDGIFADPTPAKFFEQAVAYLKTTGWKWELESKAGEGYLLIRLEHYYWKGIRRADAVVPATDLALTKDWLVLRVCDIENIVRPQ